MEGEDNGSHRMTIPSWACPRNFTIAIYIIYVIAYTKGSCHGIKGKHTYTYRHMIGPSKREKIVQTRKCGYICSTTEMEKLAALAWNGNWGISQIARCSLVRTRGGSATAVCRGETAVASASAAYHSKYYSIFSFVWTVGAVLFVRLFTVCDLLLFSCLSDAMFEL